MFRTNFGPTFANILPVPTSAELLQLMAERPLAEVVDTHIFNGEPYVYRDDPGSYQLLIQDLSSSLSLTPESITIVGSAKTGFSMSPAAYGTPFHDGSDVDVVVVDADRFDMLWFTLLAWDLNVALNQGFLKKWQRRRRDDVYLGRFISADRLIGRRGGRELKRFRDITNQWFAAFQSVGLRHASLADRHFSGRLYRTWEHARTYHVASLRECYMLNRGEVKLEI